MEGQNANRNSSLLGSANDSLTDIQQTPHKPNQTYEAVMLESQGPFVGIADASLDIGKIIEP